MVVHKHYANIRKIGGRMERGIFEEVGMRGCKFWHAWRRRGDVGGGCTTIRSGTPGGVEGMWAAGVQLGVKEDDVVGLFCIFGVSNNQISRIWKSRRS